ncbi:MAG TPA: outer membrane lipid asymmetry maintenance protein MlaD [Acetobacteraceae bacterium]|jgi:phospholipid/cholesterol/gamma-HCH transport system substrate-binding protein|nr:outer membrane lipid asymmetry maintenance protein MlaD [Acetobacteraceae bacterium]
MARRNAAEVLTGAVVLVVAVGFLGFAVAHSGRSSTSGYTLTAKFDRIDGLPVGADVRLAGVKVGSVLDERIDPKSYLAVVTLSVRNGLELPKDTSAAVNSESLLGGEYIALSPGGDTTMLAPGGVITITQSAISLEQLLGKFIFSVTDLVGAMKPAPGSGQPAGAPPGSANGSPNGSPGGRPPAAQPGAAPQ